MASHVLVTCTSPDRETPALEAFGSDYPCLVCGGYFTLTLSSSVSPSVALEWHQLPTWIGLGLIMGADACLLVGSVLSMALIRRRAQLRAPQKVA